MEVLENNQEKQSTQRQLGLRAEEPNPVTPTLAELSLSALASVGI
jgi:hypothetical protein